MSRPPLDPFSEVVDLQRRWNPEWYSWLVDLVPEPTTVAGLPPANRVIAGTRRFVTDANSTTFHAVAVGGGSNKMSVVSDGTDWHIGG